MEDFNSRIKEHLLALFDTNTDLHLLNQKKQFQNEGKRKAEYIVKNLMLRQERNEIDISKLAYISIGGADGSEIIHILKTTPVKIGLLFE